MSRRRRSGRASLASFGTALLPEEHGGPPAARADRSRRALPATAADDVTAGSARRVARAWPRRATSPPAGRCRASVPSQRDQVLRRVAALSPDAGAAVEAMKAIVLLANGAETYAPELLSRAQEHDTARPDAPLTIISSAESRSVVTADAVIVGSGAGGAMVARTLARAGLDAVVLEEGRRWTVEEFRTTHPDRPLCRVVPRRRGHRRAGTPVRGAAHRPGGRRHHRGELRHLLPPAAGRAAALARRVRSRPGRPGPAGRPPRRRRSARCGSRRCRCRSWAATGACCSTPPPRWVGGRRPFRATRRAVRAVASARSAARATPSSACTSTRCRRPARRARGSSRRRASNGYCTSTGAPAVCGPAGPTARAGHPCGHGHRRCRRHRDTGTVAAQRTWRAPAPWP